MLQHFKESFGPTVPAHVANASFLAVSYAHTFNILLQSFQLLAAVGSTVVTILTIFRMIGKIKRDKQTHEKSSSSVTPNK